MQEDYIKVYSDGGSRGNPGPAASAFVVIFKGKVIKKNYFFLGNTTNNVAEYNALLKALEWLLESEIKNKVITISCYLDSELVVKQLKGIYKIKNDNLKDYVLKIKEVQKKLNKNINYYSISRDKNKLADKLVNQCLDLVKETGNIK